MGLHHRVFLLSPANCTGIRAGWLLRKDAGSDLALRLRTSEGAAVGEIFTFMSGLYFRGKLAYATAFADPPAGVSGIHVIVPGVGLCPPAAPIDLKRLRAIARVRVDPDNRRYTGPLRRDAALLAGSLDPETEVVLLGSIATPKYLEPLQDVLGPRLRFPREFIGRGDMSRGSLMLRCATERRELTYIAHAPADTAA